MTARTPHADKHGPADALPGLAALHPWRHTRSIIHLQTFKWTFTGQQAVAFLCAQGLAANSSAATDLCQRMLTRGLFKSIYHREVFTGDGEVYRFSSSFLDGSKQQKPLAK